MTNDITLAQTLDGATLDSFLLYLEDMPNTAKTYKSCIKRFKLWLKDQPDAQRPTTNTIRRYKEDLTKRGYKPNTVHLYMVAIKQWFKWLESIGKPSTSSRARSTVRALKVTLRRLRSKRY